MESEVSVEKLRWELVSNLIFLLRSPQLLLGHLDFVPVLLAVSGPTRFGYLVDFSPQATA